MGDLGGGMAIEFHVVCSASMQKLTWRTAGPQNIFIQRMVDFFWNVGAPEGEIDRYGTSAFDAIIITNCNTTCRLNDVGALINPIKIGSWIDMSAKGGMDGGWYFPVEIGINLAMESADPGHPTNRVCPQLLHFLSTHHSWQVKEWALRHNIDKCYSIGRDMGAAPPRQTELRVQLPGTIYKFYAFCSTHLFQRRLAKPVPHRNGCV